MKTRSPVAQPETTDSLSSRATVAWKVPEIMATLGPTLEKHEDIRKAIEAGASWVRLPCGYRQRPHVENAQTARAAALEAGLPIRLLLDLPSSRPRTGLMAELVLAAGDKVVFWDPQDTESPAKNCAAQVPLPGLAELLGKLSPSHRIWFCDGRLNFVVDEIRGKFVAAHLVGGAIPLKASNSIFLPDSPTGFTVITPSDQDLLAGFAAADITPDWVALSLISSAQDVAIGRAEMKKHFKKTVQIMAKFETVAAVNDAEAIIAASDAIMVARGDLGLAVGFARLPEVQDQLVAAARRAGKTVVVATQILETFAATGLPQRAELSDLSLIARQRADVIMLAKETVFSPRPVACIQLANEVLKHETRRFEQAYGTQRPL
jgi:pyruvate kinase